MKLPFVKEALHEVTFTFILSPIPEDYTSVFVPVTSKTTPCCIYSFIKSVFINYLCHECTKITRLLLCLFFFSLCALKQPFFFVFVKERAVVGLTVLLFSPPESSYNSRGGKTRVSVKGGKRQQQAAAVMEGLLHAQHNNSIVI